MLEAKINVVGPNNGRPHQELNRYLQLFKEQLDFSNGNVNAWIKAIIDVLETEIQPSDKEVPKVRAVVRPITECEALQYFGWIEQRHGVSSKESILLSQQPSSDCCFS